MRILHLVALVSMSRAARISLNAERSDVSLALGCVTVIVTATMVLTKRQYSVRTRLAIRISSHADKQVGVSPKRGNVIRIMIAENGILQTNTKVVLIKSVVWTSSRVQTKCVYHWISSVIAMTTVVMDQMRKTVSICVKLLNIITVQLTTSAYLPRPYATVLSSAAPGKTKPIVLLSPSMDANPTNTIVEMVLVYLPSWCVTGNMTASTDQMNMVAVT